MLVCCTLFLTACGGMGTEKGKHGDGTISVVATIFPAYDFAVHVAGENGDVALLLPPGSESHTYEPTAQDILKIQNCDLFIYTGGESDAWADKILRSLDREVSTLKMMDCVTLLANEHGEYDEHVWTAPANAVKITESIKNALCAVDGIRKDSYEKNASAYIAEINDLDQDFKDFFSVSKPELLIFGDRFPLMYFTDAYDLTYDAAFPGCAEHAEPSAAAIKRLIEKVREKHISTVYYIEFSNHTVADSIAEATGARTALFYTCHNVSKEQLENGVTYVSLMRANLATLKDSLKNQGAG